MKAKEIKETESRMEKAIEAMRREFASVRTGKASPALLEHVRVEAYETHMPLEQLATIGAPEPRLLVVQPYDKSIMDNIEKAIRSSELGLNPSNDGSVIHVPIPPLNEERRQELVKVLHKMAEEGRVSIRSARRAANDDIKEKMKSGDISEDDGHRLLEEVQKLTDEYSGKIDALLKAKEEEVMEV
ncbi:MAG: ribosome recycling factor [Gemmatimonadetes bacterium]|uniref:Ribosome-recycling factor n=1 Tax=Candidatus Kutchimonas denitrificans TaxID=3056748 RepID=A0AAE4ZCU9_9BACT|nr:ribosome recycling factor [Gemmatimonadota bacterium]NIR76241.1 ribosome recycling factor [Candidatus Kutchimonas denitrificans]NIS00681.1 ribosome recycling factor [Gemmatimonadota bacterium]NIT66826.1 ribosome recycling factor [Gemmatimonadota bacterium]NIV23425.1 ribosome recycling factor [Gemmatimonadota bacterium]